MYFVNKQKGGISVFLCIVLTSLLLLTGVFVDVSRIMVADKKLQSALNTSVRSTLSSYDEDLIGEYGIFGLDAGSSMTDLRDIFYSYLNMNLSENNKNFKFINYDIPNDSSKASIDAFGSLLNSGVFKDQILQYMKYKAPLTMTQNVISKFTSSGLNGKLKFSNNEKVVREKRKKLLNQIDITNRILINIKDLGDSPDYSQLQEIKSLLKDTTQQNSLSDQYLNDYNTEKDKSEEISNEKQSTGIKVNREDTHNVREDIEHLKNQTELNIEEIDKIINEVKSLGEGQDKLSKGIEAINKDIKDIEEKKKTEKDETRIKELQSKLDTLKKDSENKKVIFRI